MEKPILLQHQQQQTQIQPQQQQQTITPQAVPQQQQPTQSPIHPLFDLTPLDIETDEIEGKTRRCFTTVKQMIANKSPKECQEIYHQFIAANAQQNIETLTVGLLVAILVEPTGQSDFYRDIVTFSKDNLALFSNYLNLIIVERITRVSHHSIKQIFWVASQLIKGGTSSAENTCSNLIRQTAKGDVSPRNLHMVENLLDLLIENRTWIINGSKFMGPTVIYNTTRLLLDHIPSTYQTIRNREADFVIKLIRERFEFVLSIGKDFLRLLNGLKAVTKFTQLYNDIYDDPKKLHPTYEGPEQLLAIRTPRRLFQSCLTFDMERKISYLATQVRFGNQKRYQDWYYKQYLSGWNSIHLRCDLIRYICTIIHPSNEVLCSDIIPRWAIIGWLLTTCEQQVLACRSALFYDWCAYDPKSDNIMNIEPAILVMYNSVKAHPHVSALLIDYLCRAHTMVHRRLSEHVELSIRRSLQQILEKKVLPTLVPLFTYPKYQPTLRAKIQEHFPEYCSMDNGLAHQNNLPSPAQQASQIPIISQTPPNVQLISNQAPPAPKDDITSTNSANANLGVIRRPDDEFDILQVPNDRPLEKSVSPVIGFQKQEKSSMHQINNRITSVGDAKAGVSGSIDLKSAAANKIRNGSDPCETLVEVAPAPVTSTNSAKTNSTSTPKSIPTKRTDISNPSTPKQESGLKIDEAMTAKRLTDSPSNISSDNTNQFFRVNNCVLPDENMYQSELTTDEAIMGMNEIDRPLKVIYPSMRVKHTPTDESIQSTLDSGYFDLLKCLKKEVPPDKRILHMQKLLDTLTKDSNTLNSEKIHDIGCYIASIIAEDFEERIHPPKDELTYRRVTETSPLSVLSSILAGPEKPVDLYLSLIVAIVENYEAASFLLLYYVRVYNLSHQAAMMQVPTSYQWLCEARSGKQLPNKDLTKALLSDLRSMMTYDSAMLCFMFPSIFSDFVQHGSYDIVNNCELIRLLVATIDPLSLSELMCLCLVGSCKIICRTDPEKAIEASLSWESWEQYCFWKVLTALSVPPSSYIHILPRLNCKNNPEAMSAIMLHLQAVEQPQESILRFIIDAYNKENESFVTALIRYWSIRVDMKEFTKDIISLFDSRPPSPQVKRKGQAKVVAPKGVGTTQSSSSAPSSTQSSPSSINSSSLGERSNKLLCILDSIRKRASRNMLIRQVGLLDFLAQLEPICDEHQKAKLNRLTQARPKPAKKKKLDKD